MHSNDGSSNANAAHPPVVYVRNTLNNLFEVYGGQNIYDALTGGNANGAANV